MLHGLMSMTMNKIFPNVNVQNHETLVTIQSQRKKTFVTVMHSLYYKIGRKTWQK